MARRNFNNDAYHARNNARIARQLRQEADRAAARARQFENQRLAFVRRRSARAIQREFRSHLWAPPRGPFYRRLHREMAGTGPFREMHQEPSERAKAQKALNLRDPKLKKAAAQAALMARAAGGDGEAAARAVISAGGGTNTPTISRGNEAVLATHSILNEILNNVVYGDQGTNPNKEL